MSTINYPKVSGVNDPVQAFLNVAAFPAVGQNGIIYIDSANDDAYLWNGTAYESLGGGVSETVKIMTSTVRDNGTGSKIALTELNMSVAANKKYVIIYDLTVTSSGVGVFRFWPTYPTGCVRTSYGAGDFAPSGSFQATEADDTSATIFTYTMPNNTGYSSIRMQLNVETGANAGTIGLRFVASLNWQEVRIGSYAIMREIIAT